MFQLLLTIALTIDAILISVLSTSGSGGGNNNGGERVLRGITLRKEVQLGFGRQGARNGRHDGATSMSLSRNPELKRSALFSTTFFELPSCHTPSPPVYANLEALIQTICKVNRKSNTSVRSC
ncbi:Hypothetical protein, putative [Bodo saltans]|uniref:Membrane-associated protein n=1 Tax=Bodo saltans TaxID=75058 RepID=A0A0S4JBD2_BODSA|nr:Hypothetical protein, putative [Bodo saltans]|eukprot:CUG87391.1 Hypothetical protein, putative [Bodo saltans]